MKAQLLKFLGGFVVAFVLLAPVLAQSSSPASPIVKVFNVGDSASLKFDSAKGTQSFTYQWNKDGVPIADATGTTLSFPSLSINDVGVYSLTVKNNAGSTTSNMAKITVVMPEGKVIITCEPAPTG